MGHPLRSLPTTEDNRTSGGRCSPSCAKRFSREKALRPIVCEILLQLLPWRFCNFTRERSSSSENLTENTTVRAFCIRRKAYSSLESRRQNSHSASLCVVQMMQQNHLFFLIVSDVFVCVFVRLYSQFTTKATVAPRGRTPDGHMEV